MEISWDASSERQKYWKYAEFVSCYIVLFLSFSYFLGMYFQSAVVVVLLSLYKSANLLRGGGCPFPVISVYNISFLFRKCAFLFLGKLALAFKRVKVLETFLDEAA
jgi:hypothetical protein